MRAESDEENRRGEQRAGGLQAGARSYQESEAGTVVSEPVSSDRLRPSTDFSSGGGPFHPGRR